MEKLFGSLSLGVVLRHFLSGTFFFLSYFYSIGTKAQELPSIYATKATSLIIPSILIGITIYALHRSLVNPLIEVLRHLMLKGRGKFSKFLFPDAPLNGLLQRWLFTANADKISERVIAWADYIHFLYTSSIAISFGSLLPYWAADDSKDWGANYTLIIIVVIFSVSGLLNDLRKQIAEEAVYAEYRNRYPAPIPTSASAQTPIAVTTSSPQSAPDSQSSAEGLEDTSSQEPEGSE